MVFFMVLGFNAFAQTGKWKLIYVFDGLSMANISAKRYELAISVADKEIAGVVGCNNFKGNFEYSKGDHIKPIKLANTKDKCPEKEDRLDKAVLDAMKGADRVVINLDNAKFYKGTNLLMELKR